MNHACTYPSPERGGWSPKATGWGLACRIEQRPHPAARKCSRPPSPKTGRDKKDRPLSRPQERRNTRNLGSFTALLCRHVFGMVRALSKVEVKRPYQAAILDVSGRRAGSLSPASSF